MPNVMGDNTKKVNDLYADAVTKNIIISNIVQYCASLDVNRFWISVAWKRYFISVGENLPL